MPKKWRCRIGNRDFPSGAFNPEMGFCYAVKNDNRGDFHEQDHTRQDGTGH